jgi:uncharacterized protein (DUF302 family)
LFFCLSGSTCTKNLTPEQLDQDARRYSISTDKSFDDVIEDIKFAISQRNYRITGTNNIGKAISKRSNNPYPDSTILHFCNIQVAKQVFEINPDFLLHMPCRIAVRKVSDGILIEARLIPENDTDMHALALKVNAMLREIVDYGAK